MNFTLLVSTMLTVAACAWAADEDITITHPGDRAKLVPLSMAGYSGEAQSVLKFDLEIAGFELVSPDKAQYNLVGKNDGSVEGTLTDRVSKQALVRQGFSGNTRAAAHTLADEIVKAVFHIPGIARTKIAFKVQGNGSSEIYVADYDGHNAVAVTSDRNIVAAPAWVPGQRVLFYTSYKAGFPDIYSHNLSTGERKPVSRHSGLNTSAAISRNGTRMAMILSKGGNPDLYVANIDGSNLLQLTHTQKADESSPTWSPDGRICVVSTLSGSRGLYIIPSSGGELQRLSTPGAPGPSEPEWSPDGKTIVFTCQIRDRDESKVFQIWTIPAEGGLPVHICDGEDPSWAPNSRTVIFTRRTKNKRVLSLLDVPSKRVKDVAQNLGSCAQPAWAK